MNVGSLASIIATNGYPMIALVIGLESMGLPLPGETTLITAAIYAGTTHALDIGPLIAAAAAGAIAGDATGYWIGRWIGDAVLVRHGRRLRLTPERIAAGQYLFDRYGGRVVFFGRFVTLLRTLAALLAGVNQMPWRRFLAFNAAGGFTWAAAVGTGGYLLGQRIERVQGVVAVLSILAAAVAVVVGMFFMRRYESRFMLQVRQYQRDRRKLSA
jgi:membrane protein DedA with SNARE-associated domain